MRVLSIFLLAAFTLLLCDSGRVSAQVQERGKNCLVLLDDLAMIKSYSSFFGSLQKRGYELDFQKADSDEIQFKEIGSFQYDSLILFAPATSEFGGSATVENIIEFIDEGNDVLVGASANLAEATREVASGCGIEFDETDSFVIDHISFAESDYDGEHTLIVSSNFVESKIIIGDSLKPVLFRGIGGRVIPENTLVFPVLSGNPSSYSHKPEASITSEVTAGTSTILVAALQARNNARVVVSGSIELFSDELFKGDAKTSKDSKSVQPGNAHFTDELIKWSFHERGMIRAIDVETRHADETTKLHEGDFFTVEDDLHYEVTLQEWDGVKWVPFIADDVQLELVMLDPYIRTKLQHNKDGKYFVDLKIPDVYGVYTLNLEYSRTGYTHIHERQLCVVRPRRHTQYERFIESAYPYYAGAFSMFAGAFMVAILFFFHNENK